MNTLWHVFAYLCRRVRCLLKSVSRREQRTPNTEQRSTSRRRLWLPHFSAVSNKREMNIFYYTLYSLWGGVFIWLQHHKQCFHFLKIIYSEAQHSEHLVQKHMYLLFISVVVSSKDSQPNSTKWPVTQESPKIQRLKIDIQDMGQVQAACQSSLGSLKLPAINTKIFEWSLGRCRILGYRM